ncbi:MAG TPA: PilZ domain-containing protein [Desulfuromonadaceae bacterium]
MYDQQRRDERVTLTTKGLLDINDARHECVVDNISTIGAFIELKVPGKHRIHAGDRGVLHVLLLTPVKYLCVVVRIEATGIGLQFIGN